MAAKFDLKLTPFYRIKGLERPQLPGLMVMAPPKRAARGREDEHLVIYLSFSGNTPLSLSEYNQIASQMAQRFYQNPGSLTSAMRATVETLNQVLVERNLRTTGKGQYIIGRLILGVLREAQLILAQCGPTHVFHLNKGEVRPIHDPQISGRGLGFSQSTSLYFAQVDLNPGDLMILCAHLPSGWETALASEHSTSVEALRRKLLSLTTDDLNAALVQVLPGKGNLTILPGKSPAPAKEELPQKSEADPRAPAAVSRPQSSRVDSSRPASRFTQLLSGTETAPPAQVSPPPAHPSERRAEIPSPPAASSSSTHPARRPASVPTAGPRVEASAPVSRRPNRFITPRNTTEIPEFTRPSQARYQKVFRSLAMMLRGFQAFYHSIAKFLGKFLPHLLPNPVEGEEGMPVSTMALIAVAVPVLVVLVAVMIYTRYGQVSEYRQNYDQALSSANLAASQTDPLDIRRSWETTLYFLGEADKYKITQDSQVLRQEAQTALDNLDGIIRLDFHPAIISGLSRTVQVKAMAATDTDLYLLNGARGSVLRASLTSQGYEMDTSFKCEPGQYGSTTIGPLIDIAALPKVNTRNATLLAMDANATLLYCAPNADPIAVPLAAPELGWRGISKFVLDSDGQNMYVLDPPGNAVWVFAGNFGDFPNLPIIFFGEQVPQGMNTAIDLAADGSDLYLLFSDGHVTSCTLGRLEVVPTRCTDPVTYNDTRPGQQAGTHISDAVFSKMTFTSPPDTSLYLLEPLTQAVYRFSPRPDALTLQGQFRATEDQRKTMIAEPVTAMAISPGRSLFLSIGSQVYYASDVP